MHTKPHHIPVLLEEVRSIFAPLADMPQDTIFIDCTLGLGGHSAALLAFFPHLQLIGIDQDAQALKYAIKHLAPFKDRVRILHTDFVQGLSQALHIAQIEQRRVGGILADIGISSLQLDDPTRGFSFISTNLDMRMDTRSHLQASDLLARASVFELEKILREYGQIRESKKLASLIKTHKDGFHSGRELSDFLQHHCKSPRGAKMGRIHPATLVFQALRIALNDELGMLERLLQQIESNHSPESSNTAPYYVNTSKLHNLNKSIIAIISFHSLEDKIVKERFKQWHAACICPITALKCECGGNNARGMILTKKPITPNHAEIRANPRSRSAKMRAFALQ